jgi:hypothetical protein
MEFSQKATLTNSNLMLLLISEIMGGNQLISGLGTNIIWQLYQTDQMINNPNM